MITKFKTIIFANNYVDTNLLSKGIYIGYTPALYPETHTKEDILKTYTSMMGYSGITLDQVREIQVNLEKCDLVDIEITIKKE